MRDHRSAEDDPFYFSDTIRDIDEEAPFILLRLFEELKSPVALWCVDTTSGENSLYAGRVKHSDYQVLEIVTLDDRTETIKLTNADFYPLERRDAPAPLQSVTTDAYNKGMRFHTAAATYFLLVQYVIDGRESA